MKMKIRRSLLIIACAALLLVPLAACSDEEEVGVEQPLAPGQTKVEPAVKLPWEQTGDATLKVLNSSTFRTGSGEFVYLVGEIENTGSEPVGNVKVTARMIDDTGAVVATKETIALLRRVPAGGKTPYSTAMDAREAVKYTLEVTAEPAPPEPKNRLEIQDQQMTEPKAGYVWLSGVVKNVGDVAAQSVQVIGVMYDAQGAVVDATTQDLEGTLEPGATQSFKFNINFRDAQSHVLMVQAEDVP